MASSGFLFRKLSRPLTLTRPSLYNKPIIKRYTQSSSGQNQGHGEKERAPSTADEFRRVAEEKTKAEEETAKVAEKGIASQTCDKAYDGGEESAIERGDGDSVKERHK